jgi:DNA-binding NarL/FixJ family response regulator
MTQHSNNSSKPLGTIWLDCEPSSVMSLGLKQTLEERARVHVGQTEPSDPPSSLILCSDGTEGVFERVRRARETYPDTPILVFGPGVDLSVAQGALQAGARGFIHGGMRPKQVIRAIEIAAKGEMVAPRQLLEHVIEYITASEDEVNLGALSHRQREILAMVVEGMSNAEIGRRLYLSESTIKQHLRAAYKVLGVSNRTQASKLLGRRPGV